MSFSRPWSRDWSRNWSRGISEGLSGFTSFFTLTNRGLVKPPSGSSLFTNASTDTDATVVDHNGKIIGGILAGEVRVSGGRRVHNLHTAPDDFSDASWATNGSTKVGVVSGIGPNGEDAMEISFTASASADIHELVNVVTGYRYTSSYLVRTVTGTEVVRAFCAGGNFPDTTIDTSWKEIQHYRVATATGGLKCGIRNGTTARAFSIYIVRGQTENVGNTGLPAHIQHPANEYVGPGDHGWGADKVKYFTDTNTNSATSGILTRNEGGAAISPAPTILHEGASTNLWTYAEDFTHANWIKSNLTPTANTIAGPDGIVSADTLTADAANATILQAVTSAIDDHCDSLWLKRKTGTGNIDLTLDGGTGWTTVAVDSSWTRFDITQNLANPDGGIRIVTSGDAVYAVAAQLEVGLLPTSYIATTTASVTRAKDELQVSDLANWWNQPAGVMLFKNTFGHDSVAEASAIGLVAASDAVVGLLSIDDTTNGKMDTADSTNEATITATFSEDDTRIIAVIWSTALDKITISYSDDDGATWGTWNDDPYDDAYALGTKLNLFFNNPHINNLHAMRMYNSLPESSLAASQAWIEANAASELS